MSVVGAAQDPSGHARQFLGVPGLEVMLPLFVKGALDRGISLTWAARLMAQNPARHFRLITSKVHSRSQTCRYRVMAPSNHVYNASASGHNVVGWSPYNGMTLPYRVAATYLRGRLAFDGSRVLAEPGNGQFMRPPARLSLQVFPHEAEPRR